MSMVANAYMINHDLSGYEIDDDGNLVLKDGKQLPDGINTLIYTIIKHFVGTPSNITSRNSDYLNNLRCPSMPVD
jgi:hypothetical protein